MYVLYVLYIYFYRNITYFNSFGTFIDQHTIEATDRSGNKVSVDTHVHWCMHFYRILLIVARPWKVHIVFWSTFYGS